MIDNTKLPPLDARPYHIEEQGSTLKLAMKREFDQFDHVWNWARDIVNACPGPYDTIEVDISACANISSMFFAGLLMIRDTFKPTPIELRGVSNRIYHTLRVMCMDNMFSIQLTE